MVLAAEGSTMSRTDEVHRITENVYKGQSRQNNIVVDGIAESPHETWMESEDKVRGNDLGETEDGPQEDFEVERAHWTELTTSPGDRPMPIVVKFLRFNDDKVAVLERAKNLRGKYIFLNEDYPVHQKSK